MLSTVSSRSQTCAISARMRGSARLNIWLAPTSWPEPFCNIFQKARSHINSSVEPNLYIACLYPPVVYIVVRVRSCASIILLSKCYIREYSSDYRSPIVQYCVVHKVSNIHCVSIIYSTVDLLLFFYLFIFFIVSHISIGTDIIEKKKRRK